MKSILMRTTSLTNRRPNSAARPSTRPSGSGLATVMQLHSSHSLQWHERLFWVAFSVIPGVIPRILGLERQKIGAQ
ncbi:uncharacterized protein LY89DRAFT_354578 [Mollisia scopiformis]|uniref:Uncharacterized protein n=1 Tax=Mollisia scopiformis TaxID=149040 RepID=A0A132B4Y4_MOLSC|nr:uncharacterized protein LY89DRAFT_354578 [Mollisia scopiformis]KUJ07462.1 hypothetical protein LY89DRAFT_354578 [Mollisia scopiformis]